MNNAVRTTRGSYLSGERRAINLSNINVSTQLRQLNTASEVRMFVPKYVLNPTVIKWGFFTVTPDKSLSNTELDLTTPIMAQKTFIG